MDLLLEVCLALALIVPAARGQDPAASDATKETRCALAQAALKLAKLRIEASDDLEVTARAVEDARRCDPDCTNADARAGLEYEWALMLSDAGQNSRASEVLESALAKIPDALAVRPLLETRLAVILVLSGEHAAARAACDRAEAALAKIPEGVPAFDAVPGWRGDVDGVRGEAWLAEGMPDLAFGPFESSARIAEDEARATGDYGPLVEARLRQAGLALSIQDNARVAQLLDAEIERHAEELSPALHAQVLVRRGLAESALVRERAGDMRRAREVLTAALANAGLSGIEGLAAEIAMADLALFERDTGAAARWIDVASSRLAKWRAAGDLKPPLREVTLLEAHRGALALLRAAPARELQERAAALRTAIDAQLDATRAAPVRPCGIGLLHYRPMRHALTVLVQIENALDSSQDGRARGLQAFIDVQDAGTLARSLGAGKVTVQDVQREMLAPGAGLLVYLPSIDGSLVFAVDRDSIVCATLGARDEILFEVGELLRIISVPPDPRMPDRRDQVALHSKNLASLLFPPDVQLRLDAWSSVIIVGADLLENPPFECLPMTDGRPLGIARAVSRMPSLPVGVWLARHAVVPRDALALDIVLVAATNARSDALAGAAARPLVLGAGEIARLVEPFERARTVVLPGEHACASELITASQRGTQLMTFVAHGVHDATRSRDGERPAGLALAPEGASDGTLWCADVRRIRAPRVVELLACSPMRGPSRLGDDTGAHLGGAFFTLGTETVVASRCDIPQKATIECSVRFHASLCAGSTPAQAMQQARAAVAADPATSDPYYWGLLTVEGLADRPLFEPGDRTRADALSRRPWWIAGTVIVVALAAAVALRARRT